MFEYRRHNLCRNQIYLIHTQSDALERPKTNFPRKKFLLQRRCKLNNLDEYILSIISPLCLL